MIQRPNILLILTDQHNPHIAGYAGDPVVETQALDKLAARSTSFSAAYCQSPLCVPSRMTLWTGKHAQRCSAWDNRSRILPEHVTLPGWLARHGYTTASVGKMHFRGQEQMHGWQHRPFGDLAESSIIIHQPDPPDTADGRCNSHAVGRFPFAGPTVIPESLLADQVVTSESLAWLLEFVDQHPTRPWFFCASYYRPHFPLTAPGRYIRRYQRQAVPYPELPKGYPADLHPHDRFVVGDFKLTRFSTEELRRARAAYYASLDYVDDCIGKLLDGLQCAGCLENTIIVYTSDHGDMAGEHGLWWKRTYYEAATRVPLLISYPGQVDAARVATPVELVDLFPTICQWAGIGSPPGLDGESLLPLLEGRPGQRRKRIARSELLGERAQNRFRMVRDQRWKYVEFEIGPPRLFDLASDPGEEHDLAAQPPAGAPVDSLRQAVGSGLSWADLGRQREVDQRRFGAYESIRRGANQYRLADGRIIDADDNLYEGDGAGCK